MKKKGWTDCSPMYSKDTRGHARELSAVCVRYTERVDRQATMIMTTIVVVVTNVQRARKLGRQNMTRSAP